MKREKKKDVNIGFQRWQPNGEKECMKIWTVRLLLSVVIVMVCFCLNSYSATDMEVYAATSSNSSHNSVMTEGMATNNVSTNNYTMRASTVNSYLVENSDETLTRVEYVDGTGILIETYSTDYELKSSKTLDVELSIFGGFYAGEEYNYFVFGQVNTEESNTCEVIRIVKYSRSWTRIDTCSIYGAYTYIPFDAGSARMTEVNGTLYLHTCHEMYLSSDGYHHQANMTFVIDEESMEVTQSFYKVMNIEQAGYVSHSFNQYIQTDGNYVYRVDHGDGYPRAVTITRCSADGTISDVTYTCALSILGDKGTNLTGVSVGGFELSADNCLIIGNSVDQSNSSTYSASGQRNIFLTVTDKELESTNVIWLTDYTSKDGITLRTPQLVKVDEDHFLVMWEEYNSNTQKVTVKALIVDGTGTITSKLVTMNARLSDCQPIITSDGLVRWYASNSVSIIMYAIDAYNLSSKTNMVTFKKDLTDCFIRFTDRVYYYTYTGTKICPEVEVEYLDPDSNEYVEITQGTDYTVTYSNNKNAGTATVTVKGIGEYAGTATEIFYIEKSYQDFWCVYDSGTLIKGKTMTISAGCSVGDISYSSSNKSIVTVSSKGVVTAKSPGTATITVTASGNSNYEEESTTIKITVKLAAPSVKSVANTSSGVKLTWGKVSGAEKYQIWRKTTSGSWSKLGTTTSTSYTDKTAKAGTTYSYRLRCVKNNGTTSTSFYSSSKKIRRLTNGKISSLTNTASGIKIKWSKVTGASGYYVYRKTESGSFSKIKTISSASMLTYTDTSSKLVNGTTYTYCVKPYYKSGSTTYTGSYTAKKTVRLTSNKISSMKNSSSKKMTVKWTTNSKVTAYQIQYSMSSTFSSGNKTVTVSNASTSSKTIGGLTKNKTYYVRIRSYKMVSGTKYYSAWSSKKRVKISK